MTAVLSRGSERPSVLFVYPIDATFIQRDQELLERFCSVTPFHFTGRVQYRSFLFRVADCDIVFSWFALGFAAVANVAASILHRASIVVSGGWDVTRLPEIGYGRLLTPRGALVAKLAVSSADRVLAFSTWSERAIRALAPNCTVDTVPLGVDIDKFRPNTKEKAVVCIANVNRENVVRKGLAIFAKASRFLPEVRFHLVGRHLDDASEELKSLAGPNMSLNGWLPERELVDLLARAKVYAQPSYVEGFGLALAEAMASGCVPVVTKSGAMPEIVGETGFFSPYGDPERLAQAIREALVSENGKAARARIVDNFSMTRRFHALRKTVEQVWPRS